MSTLKVFVVANPATQNEWAVLKSSKFANTYSFDWVFTDDLNQAHIFIWDGLKSVTNIGTHKKIEKLMAQEGHILLWVRHLDFLESYKTLSVIDLDQMRYVEINKTQLNPGSMIWALNECKKKLINV